MLSLSESLRRRAARMLQRRKVKMHLRNHLLMIRLAMLVAKISHKAAKPNLKRPSRSSL